MTVDQIQRVDRLELNSVGMMVLMTAPPTKLGFHLAVMLASLKLKDAWKAARSAYWTMKGPMMAVNSAGMMAATKASPRLMDSQTADH